MPVSLATRNQEGRQEADQVVARGLNRFVLETIRTQVFNIGPPTL